MQSHNRVFLEGLFMESNQLDYTILKKNILLTINIYMF